MVLSSALRRRLQAGLASLVYAEAVEVGWVEGGGGPPPVPDANLLKSIRRLYQVRGVQAGWQSHGFGGLGFCGFLRYRALLFVCS